MIISVPPMEQDPWPTLGPAIVRWMETNLVFGPGDLRGQPYRLDSEKKALLYRAYEVYPEGHPQAGRRRFRRVSLSLRKGSAKSELAAAIAAAELHADAPVRVSHFVNGVPKGRGVIDPYIPLVAYTEEQTEDLTYYALRVMLSEGPLAGDFDIGLERIMRRGGDGKAVALSAAPDARDGARTTFQHFDETHRFTLPRLKAAHRTMLANLPKRQIADPWALETTTAPSPGEGSVAEDSMDYARAVEEGQRTDSRLFFFHRQASDKHDLSTVEGIRAAVLEASGPVAAWSDIEGIVEQWQDPKADLAYLERVWLNRPVQASHQAFDVEQWKSLADLGRVIRQGEMITLGFDGSRYVDATALIATHLKSGFQWPIAIWERPLNAIEWEVPRDQVQAAIDEAFSTWNVWILYIDPYHWDSEQSEWSGKYGEKKVKKFDTTKVRPMAAALKAFRDAITLGDISHNGDLRLQAHVGNACRRNTTFVDEDGQPIWVMTKDRPDSNRKIDAAMAAVLSWQARNDAIAAGAAKESAWSFGAV